MKSSKITDIMTRGRTSPLLSLSKTLLITALIGGALSACSVRTEPVITSTEGVRATVDAVALLRPDETQAERSALYLAIVEVMSSAGIDMRDDADLVADLAISLNSAQGTLYEASAGQEGPPPEPIVTVRERKLTDGCKANRIRARLATFSRDTGALTNATTAEAIACEGDEIPYREIAEVLVVQLASN